MHDHPALHAATAAAHGGTVAALVVRPECPTSFWHACARDLSLRLSRLGAALHIRDGSAQDAVPQFCADCAATNLHYNRPVPRGQHHDNCDEEETGVLKQLQQQTQKGESSRANVKISAFWSGCLYTPEQLPFRLSDMPIDCDEFGKRVANIKVSPPLPAPESITSVQGLPLGHDYHSAPTPPNSLLAGESLALSRVRDYVNGKSVASVVHHNSDSSIDHTLSSEAIVIDSDDAQPQATSHRQIDTKIGRLGPLLTAGCVSPRRVWHDVMQGVSEHSVRRFCAEFELVLRDFLAMLSLKQQRLRHQAA